MANSPYFGRPIGLNTKYRVLEDATKTVLSTDTGIYAGRAVELVASGANKGQLQHAQTATRMYGLAKFHKNAYMDETSGAFGAYGSGQGTVVMNGIVEVRAVTFTASDGSETVVAAFDASFLTANAGVPVYVNLAVGADFGKLTVTEDAGGTENTATMLGYLTKVPASATDSAELRLVL